MGILLRDVPNAAAILDRFLHQAEMIQVAGRSYCLKERALQENLKKAD